MTGHAPPTLGYVERNLTPTVLDAIRTARVVALLGPRQAGKSTLARHLAAGELAADYVTLDDEPVRAGAAADPVGFVAGLTGPAVIDEVQRAPELLLAIKSRVDRDDRPGQFLLTGSANLRRLPAVGDALPGRVDYLTLWPFTQGELGGRRDDFLTRALTGDVPAVVDAPVGLPEYADAILTGGFPEARRRTGPARVRFFDGYVQSIVDRDVEDVASPRDPAAVGTVLRLVAARSGSLARYETLARDAGVDGKTVKSHVEALERLYLVRIRRPWHVNLGKREVKAPKLYVADTGLLAGLVGADPDRLLADGHRAGAVLETFVTNELERQASWSAEPLTLWHYRAGEREVDAIVERPSGEIAAIEVKARATVRSRDFATLAHMRDALGPRLTAGIVLYTGERTVPFGDRLWAVPLQALWT